jgi:hypothetical protein
MHRQKTIYLRVGIQPVDVFYYLNISPLIFLYEMSYFLFIFIFWIANHVKPMIIRIMNFPPVFPTEAKVNSSL